MPSLYQNDKVNSRHLFTVLDIYQFGNTVQYSGMTNAEIRRENARWLSTQCGGPTQFADKLELSQSRVSQLIGQNPIKNIGSATARKMEEAFGKPMGWLDTPHAWEEEAKGTSMQAPNIALEISRLVSLYAEASEDGRNQIMRMAESAEKEEDLRGGRSTARNQL